MAEITAAMVKSLRERTGAAMMLCKEALVENNGDVDEAIVYIRKKLGAKLSDRGDRVAAEGVIAVAVVDSRDAAIIELNSETDFVARNEDFKLLASQLAHQVAHKKGGTVDVILEQPYHGDESQTMQEKLHDVFTKLRERIVFRRFELISTDERGVLATYVHVPANDRIGVLVELEAPDASTASTPEARTAGKEIAMQVAAGKPHYATREDVPAAKVEQELSIARDTARNEGKPEAAIEKIAQGRLKAFYEEVVLLDQGYLRDPKKTVEQYLKDAGFKLRQFVRYEVGEVTDAGAAAEAATE